MNTIRKLGWGSVLAVALTMATAYANDCNKICMSGGDIPFPFGEPNQHTELAHLENYTLVGKILVYEGQGFLQIEFERHPWLASEYRKKYPIYPLLPISQGWMAFKGKRVRLDVRAGYYLSSGEPPKFNIWLTSLTEPLVLLPDSRRPRPGL